MAYSYTNSKGRTYYLHSQETTLKNGGQQTIYYFAKEARPNAIDAVPAGYKVSESRNGLPVLKADAFYIGLGASLLKFLHNYRQ